MLTMGILCSTPMIVPPQATVVKIKHQLISVKHSTHIMKQKHAGQDGRNSGSVQQLRDLSLIAVVGFGMF